jgi:hypothetical protein
MAVVVVAAIRTESRRPPPRPTDFAAHRRDTVDKRDQLGDVMAVAAGERPGERDPQLPQRVGDDPWRDGHRHPLSLTTDADAFRQQAAGPSRLSQNVDP